MYQNKKSYLGEIYRINDGISMSEEFLRISMEDEKAAEILYRNGNYNQSVYYYIQSMEKYIKCYICKKIDVTNTYFANELRNLGHSLDAATDFFIEILAGSNDVLREQVSEQLKQGVFKGIRFSAVHNAVRYPFYRNESYSVTKMSKKDCETVSEIYSSLKKYMGQMYIKL